PDQGAALRQAVGLVALGIALAADKALTGLLGPDDPQAVDLALFVLATGVAALRTRAEDSVLVHALPDDLGKLALVVVHQVVGVAQHLAGDLDDLVLGDLARGDLVHVG